MRNARRLPGVEVIACADVVPERARERAEQFGARACSVAEVLGDPSIELVLNLTVPRAHAEVTLAAIEAGKHVYSEKPLAISREDGRRILRAAARRGVRVGCAPDTFLGPGLQTCRALFDSGELGEPVGASAFMMGHGPESWHPQPAFYYDEGGGPLLDMGPYYLTALVSLLGPVRAVVGMNRITSADRVVTSRLHYGERIPVKTPTHILGTLEFRSGALVTMTMSFDVWATHAPRLEIYGTKGSLSLPDPNTFGGPVRVWLEADRVWRDVQLRDGRLEEAPWAGASPSQTPSENWRGVGPADMALAIESGRPHRASGELAYHVLDAMHAVLDAGRERRFVEVTSTCERPAPMGT